jgi:molybdate transport system substrate-binding protein
MKGTLTGKYGKQMTANQRKSGISCGLLAHFGNGSAKPRQKRSTMRMNKRATLVYLLAATLGFSFLVISPGALGQQSTQLIVAAAADLSSAMQEIADRYQKQSGATVKLSFGASGALTQQIENGAPFDLFFSADMDYPRHLIAASEADGGSLYGYAIGKLVLWVPSNSPLEVQQKGMSVLLDPSVRKISIANPEHAPYGRAAVAALKHTGLYDRVSDRLVLGENIAQAAQFVESGNAQVGFVALAHAVAPSMRGKGKYWVVPAEDYPPLVQGVVVLSHSQNKKEAAEFLAYIKTKEISELLRKYGFEVP